MYNDFIVRMSVRMYRRELVLLSPGTDFFSGAVSGYKALATTYLRVVARDDSPAALVTSIIGAIIRVVAAAQTVDVLVWFNKLDIVVEANAVRIRRGKEIRLCTLVAGLEAKFGTIDSSCHLGIPPIGTLSVVSRLDETSRELLGTVDNTGGTCAPRNGVFKAIRDRNTNPLGQDEAEPCFGMDRQSPRGWWLRGRDRNKSQDDGQDKVNKLVGQHGYRVCSCC
jgi:hypothetical protein